MVLAIPLTQAAVGPFAAFNVCVREMTPHAYSIDSRYSDASEPPSLAGGGEPTRVCGERWPRHSD